MARSQALGIKRLEDVLFVVHDIERSTVFYKDTMDFAWTAKSSEALEEASGQTSRVFEAGQCRVTVVSPLKANSAAGRYLARHPDGITTLIFEVEDLEATFKVLEERGGTFVDDIQWTREGEAAFGFFEITTPFGEGRFRFVQRINWTKPNPGFDALPVEGPSNRYNFELFDHTTSNFFTLRPMVLWCKEVLGFEEYWDVEFHTEDGADEGDHGSGLKSVVLWDPHSGVKFANNEPKRPNFEASQIYTFAIENRGEGFQHLAITTKDIISTVQGMRAGGVSFMPTPERYYNYLPTRLKALGVGDIEEDIEVLKAHEILVDGKGPGSYLLQIFLKEGARLYGDEKAGPFFFEVIQRKGDKGFGAGNFRALFESIEFEQKQRLAAAGN